jgi:DNA topoisomerase I
MSSLAGQALMAALKKDRGVRDPEALGGWIKNQKRQKLERLAQEKGSRATERGGELVEATPEDRKRLGIPPAWTDVKVDRKPGAALLATGKDAKGRTQRVYSAEHHEKQAAAKFARIGELHEKLPQIDRRLSADAQTNDAALAALLIRRMGLRPGSDVDTGAEKKAYGATNMRASDVEVSGDVIRARFTGKKGVDLDLSHRDPELARLLRERKKGKTDTERLLDTNERKLRDYMKDAAPGVKPKDFRTYLGTATAASLVSGIEPPKSKREYLSKRREVGKQVSEILGNTPTVALASYIAPSVFGDWDVSLLEKK